MTLTSAQLDELEARARATAHGQVEEYSDTDILQLVAVYRAALAWQQERKTSRNVADMALIVALTGRPVHATGGTP